VKEECEALTLARSTESAKQTSCEATRAREASGCEATVCEADPVRAAQQWATQPVLAGDYVARSAYSLKPANLFKRVIHPALRRGQAAHAEHVCHRFRAASEADLRRRQGKCVPHFLSQDQRCKAPLAEGPDPSHIATMGHGDKQTSASSSW
jgi:hypothetical protein